MNLQTIGLQLHILTSRRSVLADGQRHQALLQNSSAQTIAAVNNATEKRHPTMWYDPATGYHLLAATMDDRNIGIWKQDASKNWVLEGSFRPQTDLPYLTRPDWFIWDGAFCQVLAIRPGRFFLLALPVQF